MLPLVARGIASLAGRMLTRNPRLGKNLVSLYRGESFPQRNISSLKRTAKHFNTTLAKMKKDTLSGQWYTPNPDHARSYASGLFSKVKEVKVTPKELAAFYRYKDKVNKTNVKFSVAAQMGRPFKQHITESPAHVIIPRYKLKTLPSTSDWLIKEKLRNRLYGIRSLLGI